MRDKNRIKRIIEKLQTFWENNPDLRFNQFVSNANESVVSRGDFFHVEDDKFEQGLDFLIEHQNGRKDAK